MARELQQVTIPQSVLALDSDEVHLQMIKNYFSSLGVETLSLNKDPKEAWDQIRTTTYDFLIFDWELPDFPGVMLFNRIRSLPQFAETPVMLLSTVSYPKEFKLFQEYPLSMLVEKPLTKQKFERRVNDLLKEQSFLHQNEQVIDSVISQITSGKNPKAFKVLTDMIAASPNPAPVGFLAGKKLMETGNFAAAERIYKFILDRDHQSILAMAGMAKALIKQERYQEASSALQFAHKHSPKSLDRLHLLGEMGLKQNKTGDAKKWFNDALALDPDSSTAKAGIVVADNIDVFVKGNPDADIPQNFASLLNLIGITMVREQKFAEGISQYQSALQFVSTNTDKAKLCFNAGLGCLKKKDKVAAYQWFKQSVALNPENFDKSAQYLKKLEEDPAIAGTKAEAKPAKPTADDGESEIL